ncbi:MAG: response regulator [Opitutaceae bacterium]|nr:response regulator [Opitutaceae bacterium]
MFLLLSLVAVGAAPGCGADAEAVPLVAPAEPRPVLVNYRSFWNLDEAARHREHEVRFEAEVLFYDPLWRVMWLENEGMPLYCNLGTATFPVRVGQLVRLECRVLPTRGFEPEDLRLTVVGEAPPRQPPVITGRPDLAERYHESLVTVAGLVEKQVEVDSRHVRLSMVVDGRAALATVLAEEGAAIPDYTAQVVEVTGLLFLRKTADGTIGGDDLWVGGFAATRVLSSFASDARFEREEVGGERLRSQPEGEVVLVRGEVRATDSGRSIVVWDESNQILVLSAQTGPVQPGDEVEVVGRLQRRGPEIVLTEGLWRRRGPAPTPEDGVRFKLRRIAQVLELGLDEARRGHRVELWGVVTWSSPDVPYFYIQDSTRGVCIRSQGPWTLRPPLLGTSVRVTGRTGAGDFAPLVEFENFATEGSMQLPEPRLITLDQAQSGAEEACRLELRGFLREVRTEGPWTELELTTPAGEFTARMITPASLDELQGAVVRLRGVCTAVADERGELAGIQLLVATRRDIAVEEPATADPFAGAVVPMASLRRFGPLQTPYRRLRVLGVVTYADPGRWLVVQDGAAGLEVLARAPAKWSPGDSVEVVGFPGRQGSRIVLREAQVRRVADQSSPVPLELPVGPKPTPAWDNQLVRGIGLLDEILGTGDELHLLLKSGDERFMAIMPQAAGVRSALRRGGTVQFTGVYRMEFDVYGRPSGFLLQLRDAGDLVELTGPPWFTGGRALGALAVIGVGAGLALLWATTLRRRVRAQTEQIRAQLENQAKLEAELQKAAKLESLGLLAGGIAHDFNNLLTVVMGNITLTMLEEQAMAVAGDCLRDAERGAQRARDLTHQLLTFAKGGDPLRAAEVVPEIVREAAEFVLRGSAVKCDYDFEAGLWAADVDRGQIGQVVHNLVLNAAQAMPQGGVVRVKARNTTLAANEVAALPAGRYVVLTLADTGPGMAVAVLAKLFDPYFTTKKGGSGLGLATVHSIVLRHRGHIEVQSTLGHGTVFRIWLPAAAGEAAEPATARAVVPTRLSGRVLVLDDEEDIRRLVVSLLRRLGLDPVAVADGAAAIRAYTEARDEGRPFALTIMDLTVPGGMGGREAMETLRRLDPTIRAIVSSGYSNDPVMANFGEYGFRGRVEKPYAVEKLMECIGRVLSEGER